MTKSLNKVKIHDSKYLFFAHLGKYMGVANNLNNI